MLDRMPREGEAVIGLRPGERIRASVAVVYGDGSALLGMLGHYVRVQCRRGVKAGDELLVEVVCSPQPDGSEEIWLRCVDESAPDRGPFANGGGPAAGLDLRA